MDWKEKMKWQNRVSNVKVLQIYTSLPASDKKRHILSSTVLNFGIFTLLGKGIHGTFSSPHIFENTASQMQKNPQS